MAEGALAHRWEEPGGARPGSAERGCVAVDVDQPAPEQVKAVGHGLGQGGGVDPKQTTISLSGREWPPPRLVAYEGHALAG